VRQGVRDPRDRRPREPGDTEGAVSSLYPAADRLTFENADGRGLPRPSGRSDRCARYFAGRTSIWANPPGVRLLSRICVPVFGVFTLFHSDW
jgi:hypothetical protein